MNGAPVNGTSLPGRPPASGRTRPPRPQPDSGPPNNGQPAPEPPPRGQTPPPPGSAPQASRPSGFGRVAAAAAAGRAAAAAATDSPAEGTRITRALSGLATPGAAGPGTRPPQATPDPPSRPGFNRPQPNGQPPVNQPPAGQSAPAVGAPNGRPVRPPAQPPAALAPAPKAPAQPPISVEETAAAGIDVVSDDPYSELDAFDEDDFEQGDGAIHGFEDYDDGYEDDAYEGADPDGLDDEDETPWDQLDNPVDRTRAIDATLARFSAVHDQIAEEEAERRNKYSWLLGKRSAEPELGKDMPFDFVEGRDAGASRMEWKAQERKRRSMRLLGILAIVIAVVAVLAAGVIFFA